MSYVIAALVGLLVLVSIGFLLLSYGRYLSSIEVEWRDKVFNRFGEFFELRRVFEQPIPAIEPVLQEERQKAFARFFDQISITALQEYDGIGPVTMNKLRNSGYRTVGSLLTKDAQSKLLLIPGFGPSKVGDVYAAVEQITKGLAEDFVTQGHPEYVKLTNLEKELAATHQQQIQLRIAELLSLQKLMEQHENLWESAKQITFRNYLLRKMPKITYEIFNAPLPEVPKLTPISQIALSNTASPQSSNAPPTQKPSLFEPSPSLSTLPVKELAPEIKEVLDDMYTLARFGFLIAKADGKVAQSERQTIRSFLAKGFSGMDIVIRHIDPCLEQVEKEVPNKDEILKTLKANFTPDEHEQFCLFGLEIVAATGKVSIPKFQAVDEARRFFGGDLLEQQAQPKQTKSKPIQKPKGKSKSISKSQGLAAKPAEVPQPKPFTPPSAPTPTTAPVPLPTPAPTPDYREILEIEKGVELTPELIRRKFNLLWDRNDPKKVEAMGKKFVQLAEDTRKGVRDAAEKLIAPFGVPLEVPQEAPPADIRHNPDLDDIFGM